MELKFTVNNKSGEVVKSSWTDADGVEHEGAPSPEMLTPYAKEAAKPAIADMSKIQSAANMGKVPLNDLHRLIEYRSAIAKDILSEMREDVFKLKMRVFDDVNELIMELLAI